MKSFILLVLIVLAGCCPVYLPENPNLDERQNFETVTKILDNSLLIYNIVRDTLVSSPNFRKVMNETRLDSIHKIVEKSFHCNCRFIKSEKKAMLSDNDKFAVANFIMLEDETKRINLIFTFIKRNEKWLLDDLMIK